MRKERKMKGNNEKNDYWKVRKFVEKKMESNIWNVKTKFGKWIMPKGNA
jgi:hypothetical protein